MKKTTVLSLIIGMLFLFSCSKKDATKDSPKTPIEKPDNKTADPKAEGSHEVATDSKVAVSVEANKLCPVSDEEIDADIFTEYEGKKVFFCCKGCMKKFKADPAKYLKADVKTEEKTEEKTEKKVEEKKTEENHDGHNH
ncbi:MAG: YHS domain-containing protein [Lentisphaeria bacterium]|nr:YHS domain-containing protein [Lentisphaeria bacterium]NQZ69281.1 YHS domain-containing protein [Lentisphaeria bacterium]